MDERGPDGLAPRRGRIRPGENEPPPLWFGVAFALVGFGFGGFALSTVHELSLGLLGVLGISLLFASVGVGMTLTSLRAPAGRVPARGFGQDRGVEVFTRSPMRILVDLVLAPIGGLAFVAAAIVCLLLGPFVWIGSLMFGFFGILILRGSAVTVRRGARRAVAEVGPDGIWTPELPRRLRWAEIDRIELEDAVGSAGEGVAVYRRLGIWPRDRTLADRAPGRGVTDQVRWFMSLANTVRPSAGLSDPSRMAPFGVQAFEIEQDFGHLLRSVERFAEVVGVRPGEEETAPRRLLAPAAGLDGVPGAIATNLARQSGYADAVSGTPLGVAPGTAAPVAVPASPVEQAQDGQPVVFRRRPRRRIAALIADASWPLFVVAFGVVWFGLQLAVVRMPIQGWLIMLPFDLVALVLFGDGIIGLLELPQRWRASGGDPVLAVVDAGGLRLAGRRLAWSEIAAVNVVPSSIATEEGSPPIRRLEVAPVDLRRLQARPWPDRPYDRLHGLVQRLSPLGRRSKRSPGAFSLDLDLLEDPEGLLDAIARYRVVDERG